MDAIFEPWVSACRRGRSSGPSRKYRPQKPLTPEILEVAENVKKDLPPGVLCADLVNCRTALKSSPELKLPTGLEPLKDFVCGGIVLTFLGFDANADFDLRLHACKRRHYVGDYFAEALNFSDAERD